MTCGNAVTTPDALQTGWAAVKQTWSRPSRWIGVAVAASPSIVFVVVNAATALGPALIAAGATALLGLVVRLVRRDSARSAVLGALLVAACAAAAAVTGEARGFFLLPAMVPFAVIAVCLGSLVVRRPLTGLLLNRVAGGPPDWYRRGVLLRVHTVATLAAVAVNVINAALQVIFYRRSDTVVLAVAHIATGPVFATLVALTLVAVRRALTER